MELDKNGTFSPTQIREIVQSSNNIRDRALFSIEYLTAGRVGEIVKPNPITDDDISIDTMDGRRFMVVRLFTEKNRKHPIRPVAFPTDKEGDLVGVVMQHIHLKEGKTLFPITIQRAWQIIKKMSGQKTHILRHSRITHWITEYNIPPTQIMKLAGWTDLRPLDVYSHLLWKDIAKFM